VACLFCAIVAGEAPAIRIYEDDDYLLVVGGIQALLRPLVEVVAELSSAGGDVVVGSHVDRTPSPIMLCRCRALRMICGQGFVDMKEQALPLIAREHRVRVREQMELTAMPVKTEGSREGKITRLKVCHRLAPSVAAASSYS